MKAISTDQIRSLIWNAPSPYSSKKCETWTSGWPAIVSPLETICSWREIMSASLQCHHPRMRMIQYSPDRWRLLDGPLSRAMTSLIPVERPAFLLAQRPEYRLGGQRQIHQADANRVVERVGDGGR